MRRKKTLKSLHEILKYILQKKNILIYAPEYTYFVMNNILNAKLISERKTVFLTEQCKLILT